MLANLQLFVCKTTFILQLNLKNWIWVTTNKKTEKKSVMFITVSMHIFETCHTLSHLPASRLFVFFFLNKHAMIWRPVLFHLRLNCSHRNHIQNIVFHLLFMCGCSKCIIHVYFKKIVEKFYQIFAIFIIIRFEKHMCIILRKKSFNE